MPDDFNTQSLRNYSENQLKELCSDIRDKIYSVCKKNGGHLASNLGVVELTVALYYVFDFPTDKIIFDVGHQCYAYKILSGRFDRFDTLRQRGGISGFPKRDESEFDFFNTGHSGNSLSAALGIAKARDLSKDNYNIIDVIGDGSFENGMIYEALNSVAHTTNKLIIILNDNEMSIDKSVGGIPKHLSKLRVNLKYRRLKKNSKKVLSKIPLIGNALIKCIEVTKKFIGKLILHKVSMFENLGIKYVGPIDGNNIVEMIKFLSKIKEIDQPVLLHVVTKKGKGNIACEEKPEEYHGVSPENSEKYAEYSTCLGSTLSSLAKTNNKIVAFSAAMTSQVGLSDFAKEFPDRFIDTGICEEHAVTMSAGLATQGYKPYVAIYSTFAERAFDQILHDVCMQNLPVTFCLDRAGISGADGETHQGVFDLSYLSMMPNMVIAVPKDINEFKNMLQFSEFCNYPLTIRYPRESIADFKRNSDIELGKWEYLSKGKSNIVIIACGERMLLMASKLYEDFLAQGITITIVNARFIKPLDKSVLKSVASKNIITLEDNQLFGGLGSMINLYYQSVNIKATVKSFAYKDEFIPQGDIYGLIEDYGVAYNDVFKYIKTKSLS